MSERSGRLRLCYRDIDRLITAAHSQSPVTGLTRDLYYKYPLGSPLSCPKPGISDVRRLAGRYQEQSRFGQRIDCMITRSGCLRPVGTGGRTWPLTLIFCVCASLPLVPSPVFAQNSQPGQTAQERGAALFAQIQAFQARHRVSVNGAENPSGIPRGTLLRLFVDRLSAEAPPDEVSFANFVRERFGATGTDADVLKALARTTRVATRTDICLRVLDGSLPDGSSIATYVAEVEKKAEQEDESYYQTIIDRLSPDVRASVTQRAVTEEALKVSSVTLDHEGMAAEDAALYKVMMTGLCRGKRSAGDPTRR